MRYYGEVAMDLEDHCRYATLAGQVLAGQHFILLLPVLQLLAYKVLTTRQNRTILKSLHMKET